LNSDISESVLVLFVFPSLSLSLTHTHSLSLSLSLSFYFQGKGIPYLWTLVWIGLTRRLGSAFHNLPFIF
jgi:hypothetical protein